MKILTLFLLLLVASCGKEEPKTTSAIDRAKDPVCGMWVPKDEKARLIGTATFDNADYFFCAADCRKEFLTNPAKYVILCSCSKIKHDCKCDHCAGKKEPCDCKWN